MNISPTTEAETTDVRVRAKPELPPPPPTLESRNDDHPRDDGRADDDEGDGDDHPPHDDHYTPASHECADDDASSDYGPRANNAKWVAVRLADLVDALEDEP